MTQDQLSIARNDLIKAARAFHATSMRNTQKWNAMRHAEKTARRRFTEAAEAAGISSDDAWRESDDIYEQARNRRR